MPSKRKIKKKKKYALDAKQFTKLWSGASKGSLTMALLTAVKSCMAKIGATGSDDAADVTWQHLTKTIFPLVDDEGNQVWAQPIAGTPRKWWPIIGDMVQHRLEERLLSIKEDATIDERVFCDAVDWIFGSLVTEGSARTIFEAALRQSGGRTALMFSRNSTVASFQALMREASINDSSNFRHSNFDMENPAAAAMLEMTKSDDLHVASSADIVRKEALDVFEDFDETRPSGEDAARRADERRSPDSNQEIQGGVLKPRLERHDLPEARRSSVSSEAKAAGIEGIVDNESSSSARPTSIWYQEDRDSRIYSTSKEERLRMDSNNPLHENFEDHEALPQLVIGLPSRSASVKLKLPGRSALIEALATTVQELTSENDSTVPNPKLFAIAQFFGMVSHEQILRRQEEAAMVVLEDPVWGARLRHLKHPEIPESMRQQSALTMSAFIKKTCIVEGFNKALDEEVLPSIMVAIAETLRPLFEKALLSAVPGAVSHRENGSEDSNEATQVPELKIGPTKRANRIAVKVSEYRANKGPGQWPYAQFVTDVMRASLICETAEEFVRAYEGINASVDFTVVRMKNKIGKCQGPFNLHVNLLFQPKECEDAILCEVQFYPRAVYELQHRQHLAYELRRAPSVKDLI